MTQLKGHDPAQVDVFMPDRRNVGEDVIGKGARVPVRRPLDMVRVSGHNDSRWQGQGARYRFELLSYSPSLGENSAVVNRSLKSVNGLALVKKVHDLVSELPVAYVILEIQGQQQLAEGGAGFINANAPRGAAVPIQYIGCRIPAILD